MSLISNIYTVFFSLIFILFLNAYSFPLIGNEQYSIDIPLINNSVTLEVYDNEIIGICKNDNCDATRLLLAFISVAETNFTDDIVLRNLTNGTHTYNQYENNTVLTFSYSIEIEGNNETKIDINMIFYNTSSTEQILLGNSNNTIDILPGTFMCNLSFEGWIWEDPNNDLAINIAFHPPNISLDHSPNYISGSYEFKASNGETVTSYTLNFNNYTFLSYTNYSILNLYDDPMEWNVNSSNYPGPGCAYIQYLFPNFESNKLYYEFSVHSSAWDNVYNFIENNTENNQDIPSQITNGSSFTVCIDGDNCTFSGISIQVILGPSNNIIGDQEVGIDGIFYTQSLKSSMGYIVYLAVPYEMGNVFFNVSVSVIGTNVTIDTDYSINMNIGNYTENINPGDSTTIATLRSPLSSSAAYIFIPGRGLLVDILTYEYGKIFFIT